MAIKTDLNLDQVKKDLPNCPDCVRQYVRHLEKSLKKRIMIMESIDLREEIEAAWMDGNEKGWAQSTDWPESATEYFNNRFLKNKERSGGG